MQDDDGQTTDVAGRDQATAQRAALGELLKRTRGERGLSVEQVAAELRMEPQLLTALEESRFETLGPAVFVKGYLKQYAHRLDLDYTDLLARYEQAVGVEDMPMVPRSGMRWGEKRNGSRWLVLLVVALLATAAYVLWTNGVVRELARQDDRSLEPEPPATAAEPAVVRVPPDPPPAVRPDPSPLTAERPMIDEPALIDGPAGVEPRRDDPPIAGQRGGEADPVEEPPAGMPSRGAVLAAGQVEIDIRIGDQDCWIEIADADGRRVFYGLARAGETLVLQGRPPLSFVFGNVAAVDLALGGEPFPVPDDRVFGNTARFTVAALEGTSR